MGAVPLGQREELDQVTGPLVTPRRGWDRNPVDAHAEAAEKRDLAAHPTTLTTEEQLGNTLLLRSKDTSTKKEWSS